jgi:hypothetical protein
VGTLVDSAHGRFVRWPGVDAIAANESEDRSARNPFSSWVVGTFGLAACLNLADALASPDGWAWTSARVAVTAAFSVALLLWVVRALRAG